MRLGLDQKGAEAMWWCGVDSGQQDWPMGTNGSLDYTDV